MAFEDRGWARDYLPAAGEGRLMIGLLLTIAAAHVLKVLANVFVPGAGDAWHDFGATTVDGFASGELRRPFTYLLLHGGVGHLLWNLLLLGFSGFALERAIGARAAMRVFLLSGFVGSLSVFVWEALGHEGIRTIGASGAIFGVLVALAVVSPELTVLLFFVFPVKIRWLVGGYVAIDAMTALGDGHGRPGSVTTSDVFCHLLGAGTGFVMAWVWPSFIAPLLADRKRRREKAVKEAERRVQRDEAEELDRILAKISEHGLPSLTESERETLKRESRRRSGNG
jgi:membrane associated rhomboid family serine protease